MSKEWLPKNPIGTFLEVGKGQRWAYDKGCKDTARKMVEYLPFKRTRIGIERNMPDNTTIWFITNDEYEQLKKDVGIV